MYPLISQFLLQRPEFDPREVPMLYSMLYSISDDWKKERSWILQYLNHVIISSADWKILKRRHTWDLLASLFQNSKGDIATQSLILKVWFLAAHWSPSNDQLDFKPDI